MYRYEDHRAHIFTEQGQRDFLKVRDHVKGILEEAGAITMHKAIQPLSGDTWRMMAHVDRLVELGEIKEVTKPGTAGQDRIFTSA